MDEYDLVVLGAGSGLDVAVAALNHGRSVAVVEATAMGGTCLNRGCIPSKLLLHHADIIQTVREAGDYHIDATVDGFDFATIVDEVSDHVDGDAASIEESWQGSDEGQLYRGYASFVDDRTVEIEGSDERLRGDDVVVAVGTRPNVPDVDGIDDVEYITSKEALRLREPPASIAIIGGGYVAAELGYFFGSFGTDVTVMGRRDRLLPETDLEVAETFTEVFARDHEVHIGVEATAVEATDDGIWLHGSTVDEGEVESPSNSGGDGGSDEVTVEAETLLVAAGRVPNTDRLDPEAAGVETDERGFVETDEYLRTSTDGVWALGDVVGEYLLKHSANNEAGTVARNLLSEELEPVDYTATPYGVFASPEVAGVGATTDELTATDREFAVATYDYADTARGKAYKEADGFVKAIVAPDGEILGWHAVGPEATSLIHEVVIAMRAGGDVGTIRDAIHVHPSTSEVVDRAFAGPFRHPGHEHNH